MMSEAINTKFIAAPRTGNQLKEIDSDFAAAEIVGRKVQVCCKGTYRWLRPRFGAEAGSR
jgi:hypothetical protein